MKSPQACSPQSFFCRFTMSRGKGRVVQRQGASLTTAAAQQHEHAKLLAQNATTPQQAASALVAQAEAQKGSDSSSSDWRCAAFVAANSTAVQQLPVSKLGSSAGRQLLNSDEPVLLKAWQLTQCKLRTQQESSFSGSSQQAAQQHQSTQADTELAVLCSPCSSNCFMVADSTKNIPGSYYHIRRPETSTLNMSFGAWLDCWQRWSNSRLLLQAHVCNWELAGPEALNLRVWPNTAVYPHLTQLLQVTPSSPGTAFTDTCSSSSSTASSTAAQQQHPTSQAAVQHMFDWALLQQLLHTGNWALSGSLQLLAGGHDALLPARYHTQDRLLCQVAGRQRVLLLPPAQAFQGLYPYPVHHAYDGYSAVDWEEPELEHWPAAAQVHGLLADLAPGDTLLVPAYWSVHAQLMQPACVSLELHLQPLSTRLRSPSSLLLQLSRMIEVWFGAEAGPANVRRWLQALSAGREWQLLEPQLLTVKGSKLLQCCHMALEQLQRVLALQQLVGSSQQPTLQQPAGSAAHAVNPHSNGGALGQSRAGVVAAAVTPVEPLASAALVAELEAAARHFLGQMCDNRLVPTTWLNEGISDPLYLQHPPMYHLIAEDEEAARYSSLFRHRLIANRPDWMQYATPLQLAPPGSRRSLISAATTAAVKTLPPGPTRPSSAVVEG